MADVTSRWKCHLEGYNEAGALVAVRSVTVVAVSVDDAAVVALKQAQADYPGRRWHAVKVDRKP